MKQVLISNVIIFFSTSINSMEPNKNTLCLQKSMSNIDIPSITHTSVCPKWQAPYINAQPNPACAHKNNYIRVEGVINYIQYNSHCPKGQTPYLKK